MRRAIFLHIQKTAGTSVQWMAREAYGNDHVISHGQFVELGVEGCRPFDFVSGHFGFAFAEPLMEGRYSFTFLRDPVDRLISYYHFCRTRNPAESPVYAIAQAGDLDHFLMDHDRPEHDQAVWNNQVTQLAKGWGHMLAGHEWEDAKEVDPTVLLQRAKTNLARFDHVGFVSTFDADIAEIFDDLGAPNITTRWANASSGKDRTADLSPRTLARLNELTELDRALYDHAVRTYMNPAQRKRWIKRVVARLKSPFQSRERPSVVPR